MAVAGIVLHASPANLQGLLKALQNEAEVMDCQIVPPGRIAASVETPSINILRVLKKLGNLPAALDLELVYINYEDDLERDGAIICPPISEVHEK